MDTIQPALCCCRCRCHWIRRLHRHAHLFLFLIHARQPLLPVTHSVFFVVVTNMSRVAHLLHQLNAHGMQWTFHFSRWKEKKEEHQLWVLHQCLPSFFSCLPDGPDQFQIAHACHLCAITACLDACCNMSQSRPLSLLEGWNTEKKKINQKKGEQPLEYL